MFIKKNVHQEREKKSSLFILCLHLGELNNMRHPQEMSNFRGSFFVLMYLTSRSPSFPLTVPSFYSQCEDLWKL